jgi:nucleoside-diphosphate-sugar epimerase
MKILIVGASGATGKQLVDQLSDMGHTIKVIVRPTSNIPSNWYSNSNLEIIKEIVSELTVEKMAIHIEDCQAVASCLGHNLTWKGIYGKPRRLVSNAIQLTCNAILANTPNKPVKVVLMNTVGNRNRDLNERISFGQKMIMGLIRLLMPPHPDNENAADHLRTKIGQNNSFIEWVVVRPDSLINEEKVTEYELHTSPTRSALFNPGKTSRINVGHFMASLISDNTIWGKWKGQMPVIYNKE